MTDTLVADVSCAVELHITSTKLRTVSELVRRAASVACVSSVITRGRTCWMSLRQQSDEGIHAIM